MKCLLDSTLNMSENLNSSSSFLSFLSVRPFCASNLASIITNTAQRTVPSRSNASPKNAGLAVSRRV